jgi:hypothetical protein
MRIMKTLMMSKKTLAKTAVMAATTMVLRIVLTMMNPLQRLTLPAETLENLLLRRFV